MLDPGWQRVGEIHVSPTPLLVVGLPSTGEVDRGRKLADYRLGGARLYLLVDLPATLEVRDFAADTVVTATDSVSLALTGHTVRFDLTDSAIPPGDPAT